MRAAVPIMECSVCETPWVLRVSYRLPFGVAEGEPFDPTEWLYQRDCKCWEPNSRPRVRARAQVRGGDTSPATAPLTVLGVESVESAALAHNAELDGPPAEVAVERRRRR